MIKRFFTFIIALAAIATAQASNWRAIPTFVGSNTQNIVDMGDKVYYLVSNCLYCYDKDTQENSSLNRTNDLNDVSISNIYYNSYKNYILVAYANSNIDIITKDGEIINMPDIYQASLTYSKTINDVTFTNAGRAYVATAFGYVVINDSKWEIKESHIFGQNINSVAEVGNYLLVSVGSNLYYGLVGKHYESLSTMSLASGISNDGGRLFALTSKRFALLTGWTYIFDYAVDANGKMTCSWVADAAVKTNNVQLTPKGYLLNCFANKCYYTLTATGDSLKRVEGGEQMFSSYYKGDGKLWAVGAKGLHMNGDSTYYKPTALTMELPYWLVYNESEEQLYVSSTGTTGFVNAQTNPTAVNTYDGTFIKDVTPTNITPISSDRTGGTYYPVFDTSDPSSYYLGSWWDGFFKVKDGKVTAHYNCDNSPLSYVSNWYSHANLVMDAGGNLWVGNSGAAAGKTLFVIPKAKLAKTTIEKSDWIAVSNVNILPGKRSIIKPLTHCNIKLFIRNGAYGEPLYFLNDGGNPSANPTAKNYISGDLTDQDNNGLTWNYINCFAEDNNGLVWMATNEGVISFDPTAAMSTGFTVNHIKVPRNDGTTLADYLLKDNTVTCMAVDGANRKWIGTASSGLFLVSADGTEIINKFNTENSPILSNYIYNICCDPNSNSVYITTSNGMMEYFSDSTPAEDDYSSIYAYPNPVRPDFNGNITIRGLMDNSLIKIADAGGNVIKQLKGTGGMASWDGCDEEGNRVKSGVYFIMASQSSTSTSNAGVTKILIMR